MSDEQGAAAQPPTELERCRMMLVQVTLERDAMARTIGRYRADLDRFIAVQGEYIARAETAARRAADLSGQFERAEHDRRQLEAQLDQAIQDRCNDRYRLFGERDDLRAKLERVRGLQRWKLEPGIGFLGEAMVKADDGGYVRHADLAAIIGKDGEA